LQERHETDSIKGLSILQRYGCEFEQRGQHIDMLGDFSDAAASL
jgi:hypothetical protein